MTATARQTETKQAAHTPGPWETNRPFTAITSDANGRPRVVAEIWYRRTPFPGHPTDYEEAIANARLIAAAPDLLAALHKVLNTISIQTASGCRPGRDNFNDAVRTGRAAIAKAEGRAS